MKRIAQVLTAASVVMAFCAAAAPAPVTIDDVVTAQELEKVRAAEGVSSAVWTRRSNSYTLQIMLANPLAAILEARKPETSAPAPTPVRKLFPRTQVWLLAADGTAITPMSRPADVPNINRIRNLRYLTQPVEVFYRFPLEASHNAVAIAMMIDDKLYIERLDPARFR